jgi:hypothetical protein
MFVARARRRLPARALPGYKKLMLRAPVLLVIWISALCACGCGDPPPAPAESPAPVESLAPELAYLNEKIAPVERGDGPLLRFIAIPGCPLCDKISGVIGEHKAKHPRLKADRYSSTSPAGRKYLREQRLGSHGIVVYDREGQIVWKNNGHNLDADGLAAAVQRVAP